MHHIHDMFHVLYVYDLCLPRDHLIFECFKLVYNDAMILLGTLSQGGAMSTKNICQSVRNFNEKEMSQKKEVSANCQTYSFIMWTEYQLLLVRNILPSFCLSKCYTCLLYTSDAADE